MVKTDIDTLLKPEQSFLILKFGYDFEIVIPYLKGLEVLKNLESIEFLDTSNYKAHRIVPKREDKEIEITILPQSDYLKMKTRSLVGA